MDPFYAFLIFAVLLVLENLAAQTWLSLYFRIGLPVYYRRAALERPLTGETDAALNQAFEATPVHPSIRFKHLDPRTIALREALFENRAGFRYLPVMHSTLRIHPVSQTAALTGYINLSVLFIIIYAIQRAVVERSFIPVAALVLLVLVLSYLAQVSLNNRILAALQNLEPGVMHGEAG
jgi:hypothetical protein